MEKFQAYCEPRINIMWERHVFNTCNQEVGETINQYITKLKTKARSCEFGALKSLIQDRIVCGIHSDKTRSRLLREVDLMLERTVDICRANEATATQMKKLGENSAINHSKNLMEMDTIDASARGEIKKFYCDKCGN